MPTWSQVDKQVYIGKAKNSRESMTIPHFHCFLRNCGNCHIIALWNIVEPENSIWILDLMWSWTTEISKLIKTLRSNPDSFENREDVRKFSRQYEFLGRTKPSDRLQYLLLFRFSLRCSDSESVLAIFLPIRRNFNAKLIEAHRMERNGRA